MVKIKCDLYKSGDIQVLQPQQLLCAAALLENNPQISTQPHKTKNYAVEPFLMKKKQSFIISKHLFDN